MCLYLVYCIYYKLATVATAPYWMKLLKTCFKDIQNYSFNVWTDKCKYVPLLFEGIDYCFIIYWQKHKYLTCLWPALTKIFYQKNDSKLTFMGWKIRKKSVCLYTLVLLSLINLASEKYIKTCERLFRSVSFLKLNSISNINFCNKNNELFLNVDSECLLRINRVHNHDFRNCPNSIDCAGNIKVLCNTLI